MRPVASFVALASFVMLSLAPPATAPVGAAPAITGLHVSGNQILNGAGQAVRLLGVDRSGTEYACIQNNGIFDGPSDAASVQAMAAWHITAVRVPLNEDCWLGINGAPAAFSGSAYQQAIVNYVNLLNTNRLVAIVDLHWNNGGSAQATGQQMMADADHAPAFWSSVASTFNSNSSVIFDLYNEPHDISWTCWKSGGSNCGAPWAVAGMQSLVNAVRGTGATNIVMLGGLAWSNDLSQWLANEPADPQNNVAASWHVYNFNACSNTSCYDSQAGPVAARVPIVAGEIGENDCAHGFIDTLMAWLDGHGQNYLGWAWDTYSCTSFPALITDYGGTPTGFGVGLRDHLTALASGTPTATPTATARTATATPTSRPATPTPTASSSGTLSSSGSAASGCSAYWCEEDVTFSNSAPITSLTVTLTVQKTAGVAYSGQWTNFAAGAVSMSHADNGTTVTYTYALNAGQTIAAGSGWKMGSQFSGNGTPHSTAADTWSVTATAGGASTTSSGHF